MTDTKKQIRLVVADDNHATKQSLSLVLSCRGYTILDAKNGEDVMNFIAQYKHKVALLILNLELFHKTDDILRQLTKSGVTTPPVLVIGGKERLDQIAELEHPVAGVLEKPFNVDEIIQTIESVLNNKPNTETGK